MGGWSKWTRLWNPFPQLLPKCCTPVWVVFTGRTGMLRTTPAGSVQLQELGHRPDKAQAWPIHPSWKGWRAVFITNSGFNPSALSKRNLAPSYREIELLSKQLPYQVIAFIGYRCPASSEAFPLRLPSPVYHVLTCIHRKRSHAPEKTNAVTVIQSFGDYRSLALQRSWGGLSERVI